MTNLEKAKRLILTTSQDLVNKGFLIATGGNLSTRVAGEDAFTITPSNTDYLKMKIDDICVLDYKANQLEGDKKPSIESAMHAAIYEVRPDVHAIIHTHQVYSSTLALINISIPCLYDEQALFLGKKVRTIPYAPSGTSMLKKKIASNVQDHANAYLMKNHGALVFGTDMARAVLNVKLLEKCATAYLLALCTGHRVTRIPAYAQEMAYKKLREAQKALEEN